MTDTVKDTGSLNGNAPEPVGGELGASIPGPRTVPNLKFPFAAARNRVLSGGWAREVTIRELPVAKDIAGVNMRLKPGAIREMHWHKEAEWAYVIAVHQGGWIQQHDEGHKEAEWAYVIAGSARITAVDCDGHNFIEDVGVGDLWYFPAGIPHSIQGLQDGCESLLAFDDGGFSENETFLITDWFARTPTEVLAQNFGVAESAFSNLPTDDDHTRYIFAGELPPPLEWDEVAAPNGRVPQTFSHRMLAQTPIKATGGQVRITDSTNFPISKTIAAALVEVEPGALRELHWHPNADEWQYYLTGRGRMTVFACAGKARTFDYQAGDVGYVPFAMGHYVQNTGDETLTFLELFKSDRFADISLNQWMALTPPGLIEAHLNLDEDAIAALSATKPIIAP